MVEAIIFALMATAAIMGALAVVLAKNPVYAAMGLMLTLFSLAVIYVVHLAHFVAAVQVIVYAGAVMTLFLFVIMFIGVDRAEHIREQLPYQRPAAVLAVVVLVAAFGVLLGADQWSWVVPEGSGLEAYGTIEAIGSRLIAGETETEAAAGIQARGWLLPFEATSLLLVIASVGAISLAFYRPRRRMTAVEDSLEGEARQ
jgi:NADH-quinone oxidoreductase subunit J